MNACREWSDRLLDYTLGELGLAQARAVEEHLKDCAACGATLDAWRARADEIDAAVRQLVNAPQTPSDFPARVLARAQARSAPATRRGWQLGVAGAVMSAALLVAVVLLPRLNKPQPPAELLTPAPVTTLSAWRSPTDGLLRSSGDELLRSRLRLGRFYFRLGAARKASPKRNGGYRDES